MASGCHLHRKTSTGAAMQLSAVSMLKILPTISFRHRERSPIFRNHQVLEYELTVACGNTLRCRFITTRWSPSLRFGELIEMKRFIDWHGRSTSTPYLELRPHSRSFA